MLIISHGQFSLPTHFVLMLSTIFWTYPPLPLSLQYLPFVATIIHLLHILSLSWTLSLSLCIQPCFVLHFPFLVEGVNDLIEATFNALSSWG